MRPILFILTHFKHRQITRITLIAATGVRTHGSRIENSRQRRTFCMLAAYLHVRKTYETDHPLARAACFAELRLGTETSREPGSAGLFPGRQNLSAPEPRR